MKTYTIKPLMWHLWDDDEECRAASATDCPWSISVRCFDGDWKWTFIDYYDQGTSECESLADGIAKAEAWYIDRVKVFLNPVTENQSHEHSAHRS